MKDNTSYVRGCDLPVNHFIFTVWDYFRVTSISTTGMTVQIFADRPNVITGSFLHMPLAITPTAMGTLCYQRHADRVHETKINILTRKKPPNYYSSTGYEFETTHVCRHIGCDVSSDLEYR
jgi:hypothetical protein